MKIVSTVARILLGLMFAVFGLNGFLHFIPSPAFPPGYLSDFFTAIVGLGAVLANILTAWPIRAQFAPIFARKANV